MITPVRYRACGCTVWPLAFGLSGRCGRCGLRPAGPWYDSHAAWKTEHPDDNLRECGNGTQRTADPSG